MRITNGFLGNVSSLTEMYAKYPPEQYAGGEVNLWFGDSVTRYTSTGSEWRVIKIYAPNYSDSLDKMVMNAPVLAAIDRGSRGDALIWWPLRENVTTLSSTPTITDYSGQLSGALSGGTRRWGNWPGLMFDGAATKVTMNSGALGGFTQAAMRCADFSTLQKGVDQITIWAVISHPTTVTGGTDRTILSWGSTQDTKGGWAVGLGGSRERFYTTICPKNSGSLVVSACRTELAGDKISGSTVSPTPNYLNSLTAVAFEFMLQDTGYLICNAFLTPLNSDFGVGLRMQSFNSLALVPAGSGGTTASTYDVTTPFTIGARSTTNSSTFTEYFGTDMTIANLGIMRHAWDQSIGARIVRNLRERPREFPLAASLLGA
jgi:hypothetical protein